MHFLSDGFFWTCFGGRMRTTKLGCGIALSF